MNTDPPGQTLRRRAELAKQTFGGVEDVSLTLIQDDRPKSVVFTGPLAVDLDERQYELGFGPNQRRLRPWTAFLDLMSTEMPRIDPT